jgi:hypothetical protein
MDVDAYDNNYIYRTSRLCPDFADQSLERTSVRVGCWGKVRGIKKIQFACDRTVFLHGKHRMIVRVFERVQSHRAEQGR